MQSTIVSTGDAAVNTTNIDALVEKHSNWGSPIMNKYVEYNYCMVLSMSLAQQT